MMTKPYAESCEQNRTAIFSVIAPLFANCATVLEMGSGTGQHAVYFAQDLSHLIWQTSDCVTNHAGIQQWVDDANLPNVKAPLALCIPNDPAPAHTFEAVFSANILHIMSHSEAEQFFAYASKLATKFVVVYGPFNYDGAYTSDSNARFDVWLKQQNPHSCIKDFEQVNGWAQANGLVLQEDVAMPANNRILIWSPT